MVVNYAAPAKAEEVVSAIKQSGGEARAIQADIRQVAIERLFGETIEAYGGIDILVNNAGIMTTKPVRHDGGRFRSAVCD